MSRGQPDFGMYQTKEYGATLADMADLAVRLGSVVEYDRRGDVIYIDDFEAPVLKVAPFGVPAGYSGVLSSTSVRSGSQALKLTTGAGANAYVQAGKVLQFRGSYRVGFEAPLSYPSDDCYTVLEINVYTGSRWIKAALKFDYTAGTLSYLDSSEVYQELRTGILIGHNYHLYYSQKLVIDAENEVYTRAMFGNYEHDLSSIPTYAAASIVAPQMGSTVKVHTKDGTAKSSYFDDFIITINEP